VAEDEDVFEWTLDEPKTKRAKTAKKSEPLVFNSEIFPMMKGTGIFPLIAKLNHSCEPNASLVYDTDHKCLVQITKEIKSGEEICISYIEESQDLEDRQFDLRTYGFKCSCAKCTEEAKE